MLKQKTYLLVLILLLAIAMMAAGCTQETSGQEAAPGAFTGKYIVDAAYLKSVIGDPDVIIVDARGEEAAAEGTVEGATVLIWQTMADVTSGKTGDAGWGTLLPADQLAPVLSAAGLDKEKEIIVFADAQNGWGSDGRVAWGLIAAGYPEVKIVNGGYDYLAASGVPTVKGAAVLEPVEVTVDAIDETHIINTDALSADYDSYKIVDVRADEEYQGQTLYGEAKGGHLPGAVQIRYTDLFNEDSTLKSNADLTAMFEAAGLKPDDAIVTYCTAGIRSAYMQLIMEMCGYSNVLNYDESYYRWCAVNEVE